MDENNKKYISLAFIGAGAGVAYTVSVILDTLARTFGVVARYVSNDMVIHGVPVALGLVTFIYLQFNKKIVAWADEVIVEVKKVVFPSHKDTFSMTVVVSIMLILSGVLLGAFDWISNIVMNYILG